jgi:micrococcal nuclease
MMLAERGVRRGGAGVRIVACGAMIATLAMVGCGLPPDASVRSGRVTAVLDGDTIAVAGVGTVRYLGIDTPELHHPRKPVERFAVRAAAMNRQLVAGRTVRLETDVEQRDAYGRLLAYVYVGDVMVNARLVATGMAEAYPFAPNTLHRERFARLQRDAMRFRRGQWGPAEGGPPWGVVSRT